MQFESNRCLVHTFTPPLHSSTPMCLSLAVFTASVLTVRSYWIVPRGICKNYGRFGISWSSCFSEVTDHVWRSVAWFPAGNQATDLQHHVRTAPGAHSASNPMDSEGCCPLRQLAEGWSWPSLSGAENVGSVKHYCMPPVSLHGLWCSGTSKASQHTCRL